jgi:hypothetical protein
MVPKVHLASSRTRHWTQPLNGVVGAELLSDLTNERRFSEKCSHVFMYRRHERGRELEGNGEGSTSVSGVGWGGGEIGKNSERADKTGKSLENCETLYLVGKQR